MEKIINLVNALYNMVLWRYVSFIEDVFLMNYEREY